MTDKNKKLAKAINKFRSKIMRITKRKGRTESVGEDEMRTIDDTFPVYASGLSYDERLERIQLIDGFHDWCYSLIA